MRLQKATAPKAEGECTTEPWNLEEVPTRLRFRARKRGHSCHRYVLPTATGSPLVNCRAATFVEVRSLNQREPLHWTQGCVAKASIAGMSVSQPACHCIEREFLLPALAERRPLGSPLLASWTSSHWQRRSVAWCRVQLQSHKAGQRRVS